MVAGIDVGGVDGGFGWIAHNLVEVDDAIEDAAGADPLIDGLAHLFAGGRRVAGSNVGGERGAKNLDVVGMGAGDELGEGEDRILGGDDVAGLARLGGVADVVDAFKNDEVADAALGEHIAIEAGDCVGSGAIVEEAIAADAFVEDGKVRGFWILLEALGENIGPAAVGVAGGERAVGDGVAEANDGGGVSGVGGDVDGLDEAPGINGARVGEGFGGGGVAFGDECGGARILMAGCVVDGLGWEVDADGKACKRRDLEGDRIAEHGSAGRNDDGGLAIKGEGVVGRPPGWRRLRR